MRSQGFNAVAMNEAATTPLKKARQISHRQGCLPILLCAGAFGLSRTPAGQIKRVAFFIVQGAGNCRLGQYPVFLRDMIKKMQLPNVATFVLMNEDGFAGLVRNLPHAASNNLASDGSTTSAGNTRPRRRASHGEELFNKALTNCRNSCNSARRFYKHWPTFRFIKKKCANSKPLDKARYIALLGEIYVRAITSPTNGSTALCPEGFIVKDAYISEWIFYVDYLLKRGLLEPLDSFKLKTRAPCSRCIYAVLRERSRKSLTQRLLQVHTNRDRPFAKPQHHIVPLDFKGEPG
jgi:predicted nucleotide-binding protein (sugar kinase/HSP70/actin superfamily)